MVKNEGYFHSLMIKFVLEKTLIVIDFNVNKSLKHPNQYVYELKFFSILLLSNKLFYI